MTLVGGLLKYFWNVHPENLGEDEPNVTSIFSFNGLQPPPIDEFEVGK